MKRILFLIIITLSSLLFIISCNKKDKTTPVVTTIEKLQHKWNFNTETDNDYFSGANHVTTLNGNPGDYLDFRTDGKAYSRFQSSDDTVTYSLLGTNKIIIDNLDTLDIQNLTDTNLKLYFKYVYSPNPLGYFETTDNLTR